MKKVFALTLSATILTPALALAHTGPFGHAHGPTQGFLHPMSGLDHILAMVLVGLLAWQIGRRAMLLVPAAFLGLMAVGGALGMAGINLPFIEVGIALSVVVLGGTVAFGLRAPVAVAMGLTGLFAIFHGQAHGAEMPTAISGLEYATGFLAATALLHAAGLAVGFGMDRIGTIAVRTAGALASLAGLALLVGAV